LHGAAVRAGEILAIGFSVGPFHSIHAQEKRKKEERI